MSRHYFTAGLLMFTAVALSTAQQPPAAPKLPANPTVQPKAPPQSAPQITPPRGVQPPSTLPQGIPQQVTPPQATQPPVAAPPQNMQPQVRQQPQITPPQNNGIARHLQGQITRVDPFRNIIHVQSQFGNAAREAAFHVNAATRFFGTGGVVLGDGLSNRFFAPGATIWYQPGSNGNAQMLTDVRTYDPSANGGQNQQADRQQMAAPVVTDVRGEIVRVDPHSRSVVLKTSEGEMQFVAADNARVWDANRVFIAEGLTYRGLRSNATVWVRASTANPKTVTEVRLYDPSKSELDVRGQIVSVDAEANVFVARTSQGEVEYRVTSATQFLDPNRVAFEDGITNRLFRPGATVWIRLGSLSNAMVVKEIRFSDPAKPEVQPYVTGDIRGQVVRVDPENRRIVLFVGTANLAADAEYMVTESTRYWDLNKMPFTEGLSHPGFRPGAAIWFRYGMTNGGTPVIAEIRLANPAVLATPLDLDAMGALRYSTFPPGTYTRYVNGNRRTIADIELPRPTADVPFVR